MIVGQISQVPDIDTIPSMSSLPVSANDILEAVKDLQSVLGFIGTYVNVLDGVLGAMENFAHVVWFHCFRFKLRTQLCNLCSQIHPIATAAVTALSIPYKVIVNL